MNYCIEMILKTTNHEKTVTIALYYYTCLAAIKKFKIW
jgi:hypothetical protein